MAKIAFIAPDARMLRQAREALAGRYPDFRIEEGLLGRGVRKAAALAQEGVEVFISRGGTAKAIAEALPEASVVTVPTTGFDVLRAIDKARRHGPRIGVVAFPSMTSGMGALGSILALTVTVYDLASEAEAPAQVRRARDEGSQVVVGGIITGIEAEKIGLPYQGIESGAQSILEAAAEARRIARALDGEKAKGTLLRAVLTYAYDGIVAVDRESRVTVFNPVAAQAARLEERAVLGRRVRTVWPGLELEQVVRTGRDVLGQVITARGQDLVCNKIALTVGGAVLGAVATLHEASRVHTMEAKLRRKALASGHVATARFADILGTSPAIRQAVSLGRDYARANDTVLITGETGTGKELFAQSIHNESARAKGPFVAVNCAALPGQLLESELFGYTPGAFTGASQKGKPGLFELAHGGTIFLDEIAEMDPVTQAKLLRVLQEKKVMRLGGDQVTPVDVRVVAATNKDLRELAEARRFRDDLYYRLDVLHLAIPPLRERPGDIPVLARHFLRCPGSPLAGRDRLSPDSLAALKGRPWPGNVRELQNVLARVMATCQEGAEPDALLAKALEESRGRSTGGRGPSGEAQAIRQALEQGRGRCVEAARILGISRSTLWRRMRELGISSGRRGVSGGSSRGASRRG